MSGRIMFFLLGFPTIREAREAPRKMRALSVSYLAEPHFVYGEYDIAALIELPENAGFSYLDNLYNHFLNDVNASKIKMYLERK